MSRLPLAGGQAAKGGRGGIALPHGRRHRGTAARCHIYPSLALASFAHRFSHAWHSFSFAPSSMGSFPLPCIPAAHPLSTPIHHHHPHPTPPPPPHPHPLSTPTPLTTRHGHVHIVHCGAQEVRQRVPVGGGGGARRRRPGWRQPSAWRHELHAPLRPRAVAVRVPHIQAPSSFPNTLHPSVAPLNQLCPEPANTTNSNTTTTPHRLPISAPRVVSRTLPLPCTWTRPRSRLTQSA